MSRRHDEVAQRAGYATHSAYTRALIARATPAPQRTPAEREAIRREALERADDLQYSDMVRAEFRRIAALNSPENET